MNFEGIRCGRDSIEGKREFCFYCYYYVCYQSISIIGYHNCWWRLWLWCYYCFFSFSVFFVFILPHIANRSTHPINTRLYSGFKFEIYLDFLFLFFNFVTFLVCRSTIQSKHLNRNGKCERFNASSYCSLKFDFVFLFFVVLPVSLSYNI